jgi:hypothetical protein
MTIYWDIIQVDIVNKAELALSVSDIEPLPHGEYQDWPVSYVAPGQTASPAFTARSVDASEIAPGPGTLSYGMPDGATLKIQWDMAFAVMQTTYVSAEIGGGSYNVTVTCSQDSWQGQGKRFNATLTVAMGIGHSSDQCSQSP